MSNNDLKSVLYYEKYVVLEPGDAVKEKENLKRGDVIEEEVYDDLYEKFGDTFKADMGASAIRSSSPRSTLTKPLSGFAVRSRISRTTRRRSTRSSSNASKS